jgi:hypothetical protein
MTIATGLAVHFHGGRLGATARDMTGDALWAMMLTWLLGAAAPAIALRTRAIAAIALCAAVEVSQLLHFAALDALRRTTAGHLVLGSGFDVRDFASYALGILAAILLERAVLKSNARAERDSSP